MHPLGQHINSNLGNTMYSSYTTTLLSHSHTNECLIRAHLKLVIVWYIGGIRSCSTQTSSTYLYGWYINSNLGNVLCSKYTTTIIIHKRVHFPPQNRFFASIVWYIRACESFSTQTPSIHADGRYINSNLGCAICSTHSNLILINLGYVLAL